MPIKRLILKLLTAFSALRAGKVFSVDTISVIASCHEIYLKRSRLVSFYGEMIFCTLHDSFGGIERQYQSRNWYKNKAKNACIRKNINNNTLYRNFFIIFHKDDLEIKLKS